MNDKYIKKLHQDILLIMDEIDRVCKIHNLQYYLMCGSCLGAVRHKGFIPWDDDMDIAMPREDFNRLIKIASDPTNQNGGSSLRDSFYLRWITTEKDYNQTFAKVCLRNTIFQENRSQNNQKAGIFVDVFPLDYCKPNRNFIKIKNRVAAILYYCIYYKGAEHTTLKWSLKQFLIKLISSIFSNQIIYKMILKVINPIDKNKANFQVIYTTPYPINRMIFPKDWHGDGRTLMFEGREYKCPCKSDLYLKQIYGDNYMEIPPENKRKTHYPIRIVFSDGEEVYFNKEQSKILYKDLLG